MNCDAQVLPAADVEQCRRTVALLNLAACDVVVCCGAMMTWLSQATGVPKARGAGKCSVTSQPVAGWLACGSCLLRKLQQLLCPAVLLSAARATSSWLAVG
jgi:hypothetical protein